MRGQWPKGLGQATNEYAPPRKACVVNGQSTKASKSWVQTPAAHPLSFRVSCNMSAITDTIRVLSHLEVLEVLLEVRLGRLRSRADSHGEVLEVVSARTSLEQMRPRLVISRHQHPHTVRPPDVALRRPLVHVRQVKDQAAGLHGGAVHVPARTGNKACAR